MAQRGGRDASAARENVRRAGRPIAGREGRFATAHGLRGAKCPNAGILTAWQLAADPRRRRPWRAQALAAAGLRADGRATRHSLRSHLERSDGHRRTITTTHHFYTGHFDTRINTPRTVFCYIG